MASLFLVFRMLRRISSHSPVLISAPRNLDMSSALLVDLRQSHIPRIPYIVSLAALIEAQYSVRFRLWLPRQSFRRFLWVARSSPELKKMMRPACFSDRAPNTSLVPPQGCDETVAFVCPTTFSALLIRKLPEANNIRVNPRINYLLLSWELFSPAPRLASSISPCRR